jgi:hypothetical protein
MRVGDNDDGSASPLIVDEVANNNNDDDLTSSEDDRSDEMNLDDTSPVTAEAVSGKVEVVGSTKSNRSGKGLTVAAVELVSTPVKESTSAKAAVGLASPVKAPVPTDQGAEEDKEEADRKEEQQAIKIERTSSPIASPADVSGYVSPVTSSSSPTNDTHESGRDRSNSHLQTPTSLLRRISFFRNNNQQQHSEEDDSSLHSATPSPSSVIKTKRTSSSRSIYLSLAHDDQENKLKEYRAKLEESPDLASTCVDFDITTMTVFEGGKCQQRYIIQPVLD